MPPHHLARHLLKDAVLPVSLITAQGLNELCVTDRLTILPEVAVVAVASQVQQVLATDGPDGGALLPGAFAQQKVDSVSSGAALPNLAYHHWQLIGYHVSETLAVYYRSDCFARRAICR